LQHTAAILRAINDLCSAVNRLHIDRYNNRTILCDPSTSLTIWLLCSKSTAWRLLFIPFSPIII